MEGLSSDCLCFDVNHGCSGYIYGLLNAFSLIQSGMCKKVLLLVGDTITKVINPKDKSLAIIHGDAGSATLIEYSCVENRSNFIIHSDGKKANSICIKAGGFRNMSNVQTAAEHSDSEGNIRSDDQLYMNGLQVFNFAIQNVPSIVNEMLDYIGKSIDDIDFFAFHQANGIINCGILEKMAIPIEKAPMRVIGEYGNTSCATIPLVFSEALGNKVIPHMSVVMTGFGVGLSLASCYIELNNTTILPVFEY
jgi:3-oxoacyl-[acyl-carrier-protein] synthase-3